VKGERYVTTNSLTHSLSLVTLADAALLHGQDEHKHCQGTGRGAWGDTCQPVVHCSWVLPWNTSNKL